MDLVALPVPMGAKDHQDHVEPQERTVSKVPLDPVCHIWLHQQALKALEEDHELDPDYDHVHALGHVYDQDRDHDTQDTDISTIRPMRLTRMMSTRMANGLLLWITF